MGRKPSLAYDRGEIPNRIEPNRGTHALGREESQSASRLPDLRGDRRRAEGDLRPEALPGFRRLLRNRE